MKHLKIVRVVRAQPLSFIILFISLFLFFATPALAVPGSLIYNINTPNVNDQQIDVAPNIEALSSCKKENENNNSLYKTCQQQISQRDTINKMLTNNLAQEKKKVFAGELALIVIIVSSTIALVVIILKKSPTPISTTN